MLKSKIKELITEIENLQLSAKVKALNDVRAALHKISPFKNEPVDFVKWVTIDKVQANDYNPNSVAPPEMELLKISILADGYTQPIVASVEDNIHVVVDGFHRNRVGRDDSDVRARVQGYLPVVQIRQSQTDRSERIASTIRHNRARGKHRVDAMSDIVLELKRRNWTNERIAKNLGMDQDEILRLCQITGLAELFADQQFSASWDVEGEINEADFEGLTDDVETFGEHNFRVVNTSDETRIFHTHEKWECFKAGFYKTHMGGMSKEEGQEAYRVFLGDLPRFEKALKYVIKNWKYSCEHYLTNIAMNRVAYLGQASMCQATGVPSYCCGGFSLLSELQQKAANELAFKYLNIWLKRNGLAPVTMAEAISSDRQSRIY